MFIKMMRWKMRGGGATIDRDGWRGLGGKVEKTKSF